MKRNDVRSQTIAICFGQFGPYHHARVAALQGLVKDQKTKSPKDQETRVVPVQIAAATTTYEWKAGEETKGLKDQKAKSQQKHCDGLRTLCAGVEEAASPVDVFLKAGRLFRDEKIDVAFLPSYSPARYFALFAAAKSLGLRTVMMNESHAGTEQATGWKRWIKRQIVKRFDAALVGGEPHKRHFASLGIPEEKIFTGYDAVDGDFFAQRTDEIRAAQRRSDECREPESAEIGRRGDQTSDELRSRQEVATENLSTLNLQHSTAQNLRSAYGLPKRYFLSLGRMVEKKNLSTLVEAYARFARESVEKHGAWSAERGEGATGGRRGEGSSAADHSVPALVFVGSGELEGALREQARALGLRVVDRTEWKAGESGHGLARMDEDGSELLAADRTEGIADNRVTPAVGGSLQKETEDCKPTADDSGEQRGAVFFYGFRQIEENAVFYALAEVFVLPSLREEWGLVVNEAMAAGLPVIVSHTAGCAEDLLPEATASRSSQLAVGSKQPSVSNANENTLEERLNGFVFDPTSSDALSEALLRIADPLNPQRSTLSAAAMGRRSREIVAKFGCESFAQQALRAAEAASA